MSLYLFNVGPERKAEREKKGKKTEPLPAMTIMRTEKRERPAV